MKRLAIFCDGTWNRPDARYPTNVYRLFEATRRTAMNGVVQLPKYIPGVGTGFGMAGVAAQWDKLRGGVFGAGVTRNIMNAYMFIAEQYEPGDQVYIFGFSRGAFTARSLAGMLRSSGLPPNAQAHRAQRALRRYRNRAPDTAPDTEGSRQFRLNFSPDLATSAADADWRVARGHARPPVLSIQYLGVWDTVGAMGVPGHYKYLARLFNGSHGFHDTKLSSSVLSARHAVSIDEARRTFPPTLWGNLDLLNAAAPDGRRRFLQEWLPGDHGSVGGGGDIKGLSNIAMRWVAIGAADQGLDFDWVLLNEMMQEEDVTAPLINKSGEAGFVTRLLRRNTLDRPKECGPIHTSQVSEAATKRHSLDPSYRPELF